MPMPMPMLMSNRSRVLLRAAVTVSSVAAALAPACTGSASASAADVDGAAAAHAAGSALVGTVNYLPVNPFAHTNANPLDNSLGSQVADFKPVSTEIVTGPLAHSRSVEELPVVGGTVKKLQAETQAR
jgi:hypothetical protein